MVGAVDDQADAGRVRRRADHVDQAADADRAGAAHRQAEHLLGDLGGALEDRGAAGQDDAGGEAVGVARAHQLALDVLEDLLDARLDDLDQRQARQHPRPAATDRRHLDGVAVADHRAGRAAVAALDLLGRVERRAQDRGDVVGDVAAAERQHRGVDDRAVGEHRDVAGAAADVDQRHAQLLLVLLEDGLGRGQGLEHDVGDLEAAAVGALDDVLGAGDRGGHDVDLGLEAHAGHAERIADAVLIVDHVLLRQDVQHLAVHRDRDRLGGLDHPRDVGLADLLVLDRDDAVAVEPADVGAGDRGEHRRDLAAGHVLGLVDRGADRAHRGVDVDHHATAQALRRRGADADDVDAVVGHLARDRGDLGGADVEPDDDLGGLGLGHGFSLSRGRRR